MLPNVPVHVNVCRRLFRLRIVDPFKLRFTVWIFFRVPFAFEVPLRQVPCMRGGELPQEVTLDAQEILPNNFQVSVSLRSRNVIVCEVMLWCQMLFPALPMKLLMERCKV